MPFDISKKLVVAVSSNALFDFREAHRIFLEDGLEAFTSHQEDNRDNTPDRGPAFAFVERLLRWNRYYPEQSPVEIILLSRNHSRASQRIMNAMAAYNLDISRAFFLAGESPHPYVAAIGASLYLSTNKEEVHSAVGQGYPAGYVLPFSNVQEHDSSVQFRIAFDFDGVVADDEAERDYLAGGLPLFHLAEQQRHLKPMKGGPLLGLIRKLSELRKLSIENPLHSNSAEQLIRVSIITSRNAPAHDRLINSLNSLGIENDELFFLGGMDKSGVLSVLRPHIFFDDQLDQMEEASQSTPCVHIPFGIRNIPET